MVHVFPFSGAPKSNLKWIYLCWFATAFGLLHKYIHTGAENEDTTNVACWFAGKPLAIARSDFEMSSRQM